MRRRIGVLVAMPALLACGLPASVADAAGVLEVVLLVVPRVRPAMARPKEPT